MSAAPVEPEWDDSTLVLPDELLLRVLRWLQEPRWLNGAALVSRRWYGLSTDRRLWRPICLARFPDATPGGGLDGALPWAILGEEVRQEMQDEWEADDDLDEWGNSISWRRELMERERQRHQRWMHAGVAQKLRYAGGILSGPTQIAWRKESICFVSTKQHYRGYHVPSLVLFKLSDLPNAYKCLDNKSADGAAWETDERVLLLRSKDEELEVLDFAVSGSLCIQLKDRPPSRSNPPLLTYDAWNGLTCITGPSLLSLMDIRSNSEALRIESQFDEEPLRVEHGSDQPHSLVLVTRERVALWDLRKCGPKPASESVNATGVKNLCAGLYEGTILMGQSTCAGRPSEEPRYQYSRVELSGGTLMESPLPPDHALKSDGLLREPPYDIRLDRHKTLVGAGTAVFAIDNATVSRYNQIALPYWSRNWTTLRHADDLMMTAGPGALTVWECAKSSLIFDDW